MAFNPDEIIKDTLKQFAAVLNKTEDELSKILKLYDSGQNQLEQLIFDIYKNYGSDDPQKFFTELKKFNRMKKIENQINDILKPIATNETKAITGLLVQNTKDSYYRNIYTIEQNAQVNLNFGLIRPETIQTVINLPVEGLVFSERLYANQFKLKQAVKGVIVDGVLKGNDLKKVAKSLDEKMNIGRYNASRIVRTETCRVWYQGQSEAFSNLGVKEVMLVATLDGKTSQICRSRDGKIYTFGEEPPLPFHPNERSTYIAYLGDKYKPTVRKDNQTKEFVSYKTYEDWHKDKVS